MHVECAQCVLVVGGDEDDEGHQLARQRLEHLEPGRSRHVHIEEHDVGELLDDHCNGFVAIPGFADDLEIGLAAEPHAQNFARKRFVVGDDYT